MADDNHQDQNPTPPPPSLADITATYLKTSERVVHNAKQTFNQLKDINLAYPPPKKTPK